MRVCTWTAANNARSPAQVSDQQASERLWKARKALSAPPADPPQPAALPMRRTGLALERTSAGRWRRLAIGDPWRDHHRGEPREAGVGVTLQAPLAAARQRADRMKRRRWRAVPEQRVSASSLGIGSVLRSTQQRQPEASDAAETPSQSPGTEAVLSSTSAFCHTRPCLLLVPGCTCFLCAGQ